MESLLERLSCKDRLDVSDASDLLQFLQNQTEPLLSQHTSAAPPTAATRSTAAVDRSSPLVEGAVCTNRPAVAVVGGVVTRQHPPHSSDNSMKGEIFHKLNSYIHIPPPSPLQVWGASTPETDLSSLEQFHIIKHQNVSDFPSNYY